MRKLLLKLLSVIWQLSSRRKGIRVNGISAGAIKTLAVTGVKDYQKLIQLSESRTPDQQGVTIEEVGNACAFLISPLSSGIIGDIIYVDKGVHLS